MKSVKYLIWIVIIFFYILPLKWIGETTGLGCLMGAPGFGYTFSNVGCYTWGLFRGLFLWPGVDIWSEIGMQKLMITYVLFGIGTILIIVIYKFKKEKNV